ncbi:thioredoxin family protein [Patescibacteria group bacterium]|nr:thioredoxin family protein [Patescibacteria group bacterium]
MKKTSLVIAIAVLLFIGAGLYIDQQNAQSLLPTMSGTNSSGTYGSAPDFTGIDSWINSTPMTLKDLKGKVVLVDFWTYSCINCLRTIPYVEQWYTKYKNDGLVIVGVHTPEFAFEKSKTNVENAVARLGITYPVAQDNEYRTWDAYQNQYWPAEYLIDQNGTIVHEKFGEGNYTDTENTIRSLLRLSPLSTGAGSADQLSQVGSPEMYFGTNRLANLASQQAPSSSPQEYTQPASLALNTFSLGGTWQFTPENIRLISGTGTIRLKFHAGKVHIVASSNDPAMLTIAVDGKKQPSVTVQNPQLYTLFDSSDYADHEIEITVQGSGFTAFTFTFG